MAILLHCSCGTKLSVDDSLAGKKARCPRCREVVMVPASPASAAEPDEEPILGVPVVLALEETPSPGEEAPILGVTLDSGWGKRPSGADKAPPRRVVLDRGRKGDPSRRPQPAPVWPWLVGGVAGSCLLLGAVVAVIWVLSDAGNPRPIVKGPLPIWKDKKDFWIEEKKDFDGGKNDWRADKKDWLKDKKDWDKKFEDKKFELPPFRPIEPIEARLVAGRYQHTGQILLGDFFAPNQRGKIFQVQLQGHRTYVIDLVSNQFDAYLYLQNLGGQELARDDDSGGNLNARISYTIQAPGTYKIIATSLGKQSVGNFNFTIRDASLPQPVTFGKLPQLTLPKSAVTNQSLAGKPAFDPNSQATVTQLLKSSDVRELCWSKNGQAFFALSGTGILRRMDLKGVEERRLELGRACSCLAMSAEGLIVTVPQLQEAWVIDADTLEVKKRVPAPGAVQVVSSPRLSIAIASRISNEPWKGMDLQLMILDLVKGEPVAHYDRPGKFAAVSPDGKFLFTQSGEQLQRFRIEGQKLIEEETSQPIALRQGLGIVISPDSKHVCLVSHMGNHTVPGFGKSTYVFTLNKLQAPAFWVPMGPYCQTLGFDPKGGHVFSHVAYKTLEVYSYEGKKQKEVPIKLANPGPTYQILPHPDGDKLLIRQHLEVLLVDLSGRKPPDAIPDPKATNTPIKLQNGLATIESRLTMDDKKHFGRIGKEYPLEMKLEHEYTIELKGTDFEPFLIIKDTTGKPVATGVGKKFARIFFRPAAAGTHKILATARAGIARADAPFTLNIREAVLPKDKIEPPLPPGDIAGKPEVQDGLSVRQLLLGKTRHLASWDRQGKYLFAYDQAGGNLSRIRAADFFREATAKHTLLNSNYLAMTMSADGPVLADGKRILLIDPQTLALKKLFQPQSPTMVVTAAGASFAVGILPASKPRRDVLFDLREFKETPLSGLPAGLITNFAGRSLSADGKTFFLAPQNAGVLQRYRLKDAALELAEETKIAVHYPMAIAQRQDGKYVAPYSLGGRAQEISVFESERLAKPAFTLPGNTKALCFLEPGGHILTFSGELQLFSDAGAKIKSFRWPRSPVYALIPHPTRPAALAMTGQGVYYLEVTELKIAGR